MNGYCKEGKRCHKLRDYREWIYHDLHSVFTDWHGVWDAARLHLAELDHFGASNIGERMRRISRATAANIMLGESLTIHRESLKFMTKTVQVSEDGKIQRTQKDRCKEMTDSLQHYDVVRQGNLEQLRNLLSMMIALE